MCTQAKFLVLALFCVSAFAQNETTTTAQLPTESPTNETLTISQSEELQIFTQAVGRSGKIRVSSDFNFAADKTVTVELDSIYELGRSSEGGMSRKPRQTSDDRPEKLKGGRSSFNTFANQNFVIGDVMNMNYPDTNVSCYSFSFSSELKKRVKGSILRIAAVNMTVFVFAENGTLDVAGEVSSVLPGSVKFNVEVTDFQFCNGSDDGCSGYDGTALDIAISVKGMGKVQKAEKRAGEDLDVFSLGGGAALRMSKKARIDDRWVDMPDDFPRLEAQGSKQMLIINFPRFSRSALYDPVIDLGLEGVVVDGDFDDTNGATCQLVSSIAFLLPILHALIS